MGGAELVAGTRALLDRVGAPDRTMECVLVGGTSGKGSVATGLAAHCERAGVRVGLHTSPYLQVATEKIRLDGQYIGGAEFAELVEWIWPHLEAWRDPAHLRRRYGAVSLVLAAEAMRRHGAQVGVFEVGCGGRFDPVNALAARAVAITTVGLDHVALLGPTLADIAWQKAGLIKSAAPVVTAARGLPLQIIQREAASYGAPVRCTPADNAALAGALFEVCRGTPAPRLPPQAVRLPGRLEPMGVQQWVWLDGAHNPEKLAYLVRQLHGRPAVVLFGALAGKSHRPMLKILSRLARTLVLCPIEVPGKLPTDLAELTRQAQEWFERVEPAPNPEAALAFALHRRQPDQIVVVTGSLYLVGRLRSRWYPAERVVEARSSWPPRLDGP
ncbi:folyl-polyglutamate synthetase [Gloeobacter violaceus PCC 7421]|uniref:tetrahydrofolate synthase n=1 Tax=Gloeobacter violaceus (strain ATCC 29082 / PCC 7421) TaxID=251221 RepID=Q7NL38_GLOVI|nr:folyl-polyglutamate synthetase [Gloeobacter violaceus PCC 7421]